MENTETEAIKVTVEEMAAAVAKYDLMLPGEVAEIYLSMVAVPDFGLKVSLALQHAAVAVSQGKLPRERVLDGALVPAFLIGVLVGRGQGRVREGIGLKTQMENLNQYIGKMVRVVFVDYGQQTEPQGLLRKVNWYRCLELEKGGQPSQSIPFIGHGCGIRSVFVATEDEGEQGVYTNPAIAANHDIRDMEEIQRLREQCFGPDANSGY